MANPLTAKVNQRLYFSQLHLQWMQRAIDEQQIPRHIVDQAMGESVVLHLMTTYRYYLSELAQAYGLSGESPGSAAQCATILAAAGKTSAECEELIALEEADSWLASLAQLYGRLDSVEGHVASAQAPQASLRVHSVDDTPLALAPLIAIYEALKALIDNQRTRLEEW